MPAANIREWTLPSTRAMASIGSWPPWQHCLPSAIPGGPRKPLPWARPEAGLMRKIKAILIIAVLGFAALAGWRVGYSEVANLELQEDLHDMANQSSFRFGNVASTRS